MRTLGVAVLGVFAGLAVGFALFSELVGRLVAADGVVETPWAFVIGFGPQLTAVVGGVLAVVLDNKLRRRREDR
ncbi:DUF5957 domain-containing protein [Saccharomonospora xinjiangensis]|uniref:DUF5957 family protein n=1 Tax=Saccharomonospora xinjiangensis TaxID=75294 RepID=UPI00106F4353|nr:DUF5957 family protein [Saccharomonospora xinjiangensis]QBQ59795.1 hypothetical protein EYD13_07145 [Saccharomonospora xinjiangensis]